MHAQAGVDPQDMELALVVHGSAGKDLLGHEGFRARHGVDNPNFDMLQHYRTSVNVLRRPVARGISLTGHHEINLPLFRVALLLELASRGWEETER